MAHVQCIHFHFSIKCRLEHPCREVEAYSALSFDNRLCYALIEALSKIQHGSSVFVWCSTNRGPAVLGSICFLVSVSRISDARGGYYIPLVLGDRSIWWGARRFLHNHSADGGENVGADGRRVAIPHFKERVIFIGLLGDGDDCSVGERQGSLGNDIPGKIPRGEELAERCKASLRCTWRSTRRTSLPLATSSCKRLTLIPRRSKVIWKLTLLSSWW